MQQRNGLLIAAGIGLMVIIALIAALMGRSQPAKTDPTPVDVTAPSGGIGLTRVDLAAAPAEVQEAAKALAGSRVGYAMVRPDRTYLIISTGSDALRVSLDRAEGQPAGAAATFVDIHLKTDSLGDRLLIATTSLKAGVEYQFDVDGVYAAIPTLHNWHNLPLVHLDEATGFALITPAPGALITAPLLELAGYAQAFEASFVARLQTEKGRVLLQVPVMAAAGGPSWGSFKTDIDLTGIPLPESGYLVLEDEMTGHHLVIPVRFGIPQMG